VTSGSGSTFNNVVTAETATLSLANKVLSNVGNPVNTFDAANK
jgi:hypothetical protein